MSGTPLTGAMVWPAEALGEVVAATARLAGLHLSEGAPVRTPQAAVTGHQRAEGAFIDAVAEALHFEAEEVECSCAELGSALSRMAPAVVRTCIDGRRGYLGVAAGRGRTLILVTPSLTRVKVAASAVAEVVRRPLRLHADGFVDRWLHLAGVDVATRRAARARERLLDLSLGDENVSGIWMLRDDPGASFTGQIRRKGIAGRTTRFFALSLLQVAIAMAGWLILGRVALQGVLETGWLCAWALLCVGSLPIQVASTYMGGRLSLETAELLKRRLLCGALRMSPAEVRARGSGGLLATVTESEAIEAAALVGAFGALAAIVQLVSAAVVLWLGAGGGIMVSLLAAWCVALTALVAIVMRRRLAWTEDRFALSDMLVENIIGHRTRLAQEPASEHHAQEDAALERYLRCSESMDRMQTALSGVPARGWLAIAILGLLPSILHSGSNQGPLLVAIGGILQAQSGIAALLSTVTGVLAVVGAWRSVGALFDAAAQRDAAGAPIVAAASQVSTGERASPQEAGVVLEARGVSYQYPSGAEPVLEGCDLVLRHGDRVLLEGPSGGGKSTLAGLLGGMLVPECGFLSVGGLDRKTLGGTRWRQRVASAPQFHENHILSGSLAFNLLMGVAWPPSRKDLAEADRVCRELGLGEVLNRMPSGLSQIVGETGWQLSHGERSRIFLARALLQGAGVLVLDESFGALDPLTLRTCLDCVNARADALLVIAHP